MAGNLRSPRKRALEIGTDPSKFSDSDYDSAAGVPNSHPAHGGVYKDPCEPSLPSTGPKPVQGPKPIKG
jgi:hypothetical protein